MTKPRSRLKDAELARLLLTSGQNVGSPARGAMQRTLARIEVAASAGLLVTGASLGAAEAATLSTASLVSGAVGSAGTAAVGMGGFSAVKAATSSLVVKWFASGLAVGLVAGGGVVGVAVSNQAHWRAPHPRALLSERTNGPKPLPTSSTKHPSGVVAESKTHPPDPIQAHPTSGDLYGIADQRISTAAAPDIARKQTALDPKHRAESFLSPELARELSLLDLARSALERGDGPSAVYWLAQHRQQFPNGQLVPEAALLRAQTDLQVVPNQASIGDSHE